VTADDGFRFVPRKFAELAPGVHVAQGYDISDLAFVVTADGIVVIDAATTPEHAAAALRALREIPSGRSPTSSWPTRTSTTSEGSTPSRRTAPP
jgi:hypothetical protein